MLNAYVAVESRYNEPLHNEVLDITNDFPFPSNSKIYEKEPRYSGTCRYNKGQETDKMCSPQSKVSL